MQRKNHVFSGVLLLLLLFAAYACGETGVICQEGISLRQKPSGIVLMQLQRNQLVQIIEELTDEQGREWTRIEVGEDSGVVLSQYVEKISAGATPAYENLLDQVPSPSPVSIITARTTPTPSPTPSPTPTPVPTPRVLSEKERTPSPLPEESLSGEAMVAHYGTILRSSDGPASYALMMLEPDTPVILLERIIGTDGQNYYRVEVQGQRGYLAESELKFGVFCITTPEPVNNEPPLPEPVEKVPFSEETTPYPSSPILERTNDLSVITPLPPLKVTVTVTPFADITVKNRVRNIPTSSQPTTVPNEAPVNHEYDDKKANTDHGSVFASKTESLLVLSICLVFSCIVFVLIFQIRKQLSERRSVKSLQHWKEEEESFLADAVSSKKTEKLSFDDKHIRLDNSARSPVSFEATSGLLHPPETTDDLFSFSLHEVRSADPWDIPETHTKGEPSLDVSGEKNTQKTEEPFPEPLEKPRRRRKRN